MSITYVSTGDVRGACDHAHRSIAAAIACQDRDQTRAARGGGYSDRRIARGDGAPLDEWERDELARLEESARD